MTRIRGNHTTLADVARIAGVGKTTVSRVINGAHKVSPVTRKRINTVIRELSYRPSQAARSLKGNGTKAIGLVLPSITDPFFAGCAEAAQQVAQSHGYLLIVAATNYDAQAEIQQLESLIRHRVEGILLAPADGSGKKLGDLVDAFNVPVVGLNHPLNKADVQSVVCDNRGGALAATRHLVEHGYRHIVCLGGESKLFTIRERQKGYTDAIRSAGLTPMIEGAANTYAEVEALLRNKYIPGRTIDAVFAVRNVIAIYTFQAMQSLGFTIPNDIALVGFDDFELACTLRPAITVVSQPVKEIGSRAAYLLFEQLKVARSHGQADQIKEAALKTSLLLRNSCGCP